jgi:alpha-glucosidase (family GH31 glycosyl hydrolase)
MTDAFREAVVDRYKLLPYWSHLGRIANLTGNPIVKDCCAHMDDRVMVGPALFVAPFLGETGPVKISFL